ncbi:MAG: MBL fold metallo-hydrolase [Lachnospiraceae bacterium]|nr:MBL fold metallo-hydrolase [Lachnospiraceae bacterium]
MTNLSIKQLVLGMFRTNCYIVYNKKNEAVIIDPGDSYTRIKDEIEKLKLTPVAILLTHGHFDHIGAASKLKETYGIKIYAHEEEKIILESSSYNLSDVYGVPMTIFADVFLKDNEVINLIGMDFNVIHTPGHTIGSCCYYLPEYNLIFSGDTLFFESHGRYDFPTGSGRSILESIKNKLLILNDNINVLPGHNEATTIGDEQKWYS